jgi:hypothetical protein
MNNTDESGERMRLAQHKHRRELATRLDELQRGLAELRQLIVARTAALERLTAERAHQNGGADG